MTVLLEHHETAGIHYQQPKIQVMLGIPNWTLQTHVIRVGDFFEGQNR